MMRNILVSTGTDTTDLLWHVFKTVVLNAEVDYGLCKRNKPQRPMMINIHVPTGIDMTDSCWLVFNTVVTVWMLRSTINP
jgi:hypothetical protein